MNLLVRIKRCAWSGRLRLTTKSREELESDDLHIDDIRESLINPRAINKTIRSMNPYTRKREYLHIIRSPNLTGFMIYTKGKLISEAGEDVFYVLVSSKRAE